MRRWGAPPAARRPPANTAPPPRRPPKLYAAFVAALDEATATINKDKRAAAQTYLRLSKDKSSVESIEKMLNDPEIVYTTTPQNVMKYVDFMYKIGSIKVKADSWKDLFFPNIHAAPGS